MKYKIRYHGFVIVEADDVLEALDKAKNDEEEYEEYEWECPVIVPIDYERARTMNAKGREIQELRADLEWLMRSETVARFAEKDSFGRHINDIGGIDRCVLTLAAREKEAKQKLMAAEAEIVRLRRQIESLQEKQEGGN